MRKNGLHKEVKLLEEKRKIETNHFHQERMELTKRIERLVAENQDLTDRMMTYSSHNDKNELQVKKQKKIDSFLIHLMTVLINFLSLRPSPIVFFFFVFFIFNFISPNVCD